MKHYAYFSAAIRDGAQISKSGSRYVLLGRNGGTCAIGGGAMAIGLPTALDLLGRPYLPYSNTMACLRTLYPYLNETVECPVCGPTRYHDLLSIVADLFDVLEWTREQIADWLYAEEEKLGFVTVVETQDTATISAPSQQVAEACSVRH